MYEKIRKDIQQLSYHVLSYPNQYTARVNALLEELIKYLFKVEEYVCVDKEGIALIYDLLLVYTGKIEQVYRERNHTVETMLKLLNDCYSHPDMPESIKRDHPFRHALVMHQHMGMVELLSLGRLAYRRVAELFTTPLAIPFSRKIKMVLGNFLNVPGNLRVLANIHPYVTQLALPLGDLKGERDACINVIVTELLTYPKVNDRIAVHSFNPEFMQKANMIFDFNEILNLVNMLSSDELKLAMGDTPQSMDVQAIRLKTKMLKQLHVILLEGHPSRMQEVLIHRVLLRQNLYAIFSQLVHLRPVYSWGNDLDLALNDLVDEVHQFSQGMIHVLRQPIHIQAQEAKPLPWAVMNFWEGTGRLLTSMAALMNAMANNLMPRITRLIMRMLPKHRINDLVESCKKPAYEIFDHGYALAKMFETEGLYSALTQQCLAPFRQPFLGIDIDALQQLFSIYRYQFEPVIELFLQAKDEPLTVWRAFSKERKNELVLNAAKALYTVRKLIDSFLPIIQPATFEAMRQALSSHDEALEHLNSIRSSIIDLQILMIVDADPMLGKIITMLELPGDSITIGGAANVAMNSTTIAVVADATMTSYQLTLDCVPSSMGVQGLPEHFMDKNLKQMLLIETNAFKGSLKQFTNIHLTLDDSRSCEEKKVQCK